MDKITQDNAALSQQSASASEELKEQAESVRQAVSELMRMAQNTATSSTLLDSEPKARAVKSPLVSPRLRRNGSDLHGHNGHNGHNGRNGHSHHPHRDMVGSFQSSADDLSFKDED